MIGGLIALALLSAPGPYTLVNASGDPLSELAIRASDGNGSWRSLAPGLAAGARSDMPSPGGQLCAFDIRAKVGGDIAIWSNVNLCDVKVVTLNRRADGTVWVDYD